MTFGDGHDCHENDEIPSDFKTRHLIAAAKGTSLLRLFGSMSVEEAQEMLEIIHCGCERLDSNEDLLS